MLKKGKKDKVINVRVSAEQKKRYTEEARLCNMKLSEYILHVLQNKEVTVIEHGREIAQAMYELNNTLNKYLQYPNISVSKTRETLSNGITRLSECIERSIR